MASIMVDPSFDPVSSPTITLKSSYTACLSLVHSSADFGKSSDFNSSKLLIRQSFSYLGNHASNHV